MGLPARDLRQTHRRRTAPASSRPAKRTRAVAVRAHTDLTVPLLALVTLIALVGLGRVTMTVCAAEACLDSGRIMADIKEERIEGDRLEIDKSALTTPSRLEDIAGATMSMTEPEGVTYLRVEDVEAATAESMGETEASADHGAASVLEAIARIAAEQAQVLLVGDVGLAAAR